MKCQKILKSLSAYSDDEISTEKKHAIEAHIQSCNYCRLKLKEIKSLWEVLEYFPGAEPAPYFYSKLTGRIKAEKRRKESGWFERLLIPISAVVIAVFGFWLGNMAGGNGDTTVSKMLTSSPFASTSYLDTFDSMPAASLGEVYFALAEKD